MGEKLKMPNLVKVQSGNLINKKNDSYPVVSNLAKKPIRKEQPSIIYIEN